jgi:hypothetical protein
MAETRTAEEVRQEIKAEQAGLARAVDDFRGGLSAATDLRARLPVLAPAAVAVGFVVSGGIGATMRYFARRSREH